MKSIKNGVQILLIFSLQMVASDIIALLLTYMTEALLQV